MLYHYTSLEALEKILQKDKIVFWATRYDSMNDPMDYAYAKDIILPKLNEMLTPDELCEHVDTFPYIVSFSLQRDDFNMYRLYNADVAIEFDYVKLRQIVNRDSSFHLRECIYEDKDCLTHEFVKEYLKQEHCDNITLDAQELFPIFKLPEFKIENEVRLYKFSHKLFRAKYNSEMGCDFIECETSNLETKVRCVRNKDYVLYQEFILPIEVLLGIIIHVHDKKHFNSVQNHLVTILSERNYSKNIIENIRQTETTKFINI